jgi:ABC-type multidrug transport system fused ATPase/permease subunit
LILDEPTSALDQETDAAIRGALLELRGHMTIVVIAHRLSTIRDADRIFCLEDGQLVDQGAYPDLEHGSDAFARVFGRGELKLA